MREIKFRGWDEKRKKMWSAEEMGADELTITPDGRGFVNVNGRNTKLSQYVNHLIPLQFTGLIDKNGKELYEGDIVESWEGRGQIKFGNFEADNSSKEYGALDCVGFYIARLKESENYSPLCGGEIKRVVIIGNAYETPELVDEEGKC